MKKRKKRKSKYSLEALDTGFEMIAKSLKKY